MRRRLAVPLAIAVLAMSGAVAPVLFPQSSLRLVAEAEARPRSSGGYSRSPSTSRSYSAPSSSRSSGGYSRPSTSGRTPSVGYSGGSAGDRGYSRSQSGDALRRMRESDAQSQSRIEYPRQQAPAPSAPYGGGSPGGFGGGYGRGGGYSGGGYSGGGYTGGWYRDRGWTPPARTAGRGGFGMWDAAFLWFMLSSLNNPSHAAFFHHHQDDAGYQQWRQEAEQRAQTDPQVRTQLQQLDRSLAENAVTPRDPNYLPPDVPVEVATGRAAPNARTPSTESSGGGSMAVIALVLIGGIGVAVFLWARRRPRQGGNGMASGGLIRDAAGMLRQKASGEAYAPSQFRLGMPVQLDPTPFILAAGQTQLSPPPSGQPAVVEAVGRIGGEGQDSLVRLYLQAEQGMIQLHLGPGNEPDECRFFALLDEVTPADEEEWKTWLDPQEGLIGWFQFQTKDGKLYDRVWSPGSGMVPPRSMPEEVETTAGRRVIQNHAMLYAAPTGAAEPAPQTEYILVSAIEDGGQAWVEIRAGLDISAASLSLA
jgi:hypothetical protein